jgi:hypothetical protein
MTKYLIQYSCSLNRDWNLIAPVSEVRTLPTRPSIVGGWNWLRIVSYGRISVSVVEP